MVSLERWNCDSKGRGFECWPFRFQATTLGKLFTHMCLCRHSPSSIIWYRSRGILCGRVLCKKFSCSLSFFTMFQISFRLVILLFYMFIVYLYPCAAHCACSINELEGKYSLESTDPRESEIRAPAHTVIYNKKFITAFLSLGLGNTS